jgi:hypothetical protein
MAAAVRTRPRSCHCPRAAGVVGAVRFDPGLGVIPTYNEAENLHAIVAAGRAAMATAMTGVAGSVLVVHDIQAMLYHHGCPQRRNLIGREGQDWLAAKLQARSPARAGSHVWIDAWRRFRRDAYFSTQR